MVPHLGLSFPFGPADGLGGHFQKPLGSQNPDLESWNVETVSARGSTEVDPLAGGTSGGSGRSQVRWPVVCGLAGRVPGCLTPPFPACLPPCWSAPAPACCPGGWAFFQERAVVAGPGCGVRVGGAASGWPVAIATLASRRELCGEQPWGSNRWRTRRKTYLRPASVHEAWHLSAWIGGG